MEKELTLFSFFPSWSPGGHAISHQKLLELPVVSYSLIELFYVGIPVVQTDGRSDGVRSHDYQNFLDRCITKFSYLLIKCLHHARENHTCYNLSYHCNLSTLILSCPNIYLIGYWKCTSISFHRNNSSFHSEDIFWRNSLPALRFGRWNSVLFHHGPKQWYIRIPLTPITLGRIVA